MRSGYVEWKDIQAAVLGRSPHGASTALKNALPSDKGLTGVAWAPSRSQPTPAPIGDAWLARKVESPVRVQWDPERDLLHRPLGHRSIQIGLGGGAVDRYVEQWTVGITDVTDLLQRVHGCVTGGRLEQATAVLPVETPYPVPAELAATIGATSAAAHDLR